MSNPPNTVRAHRSDLRSFADFLREVDGETTITPKELEHDAELWLRVTATTIAAYQQWLLDHGYAAATVARRLSTIKRFALAAQVGMNEC